MHIYCSCKQPKFSDEEGKGNEGRVGTTFRFYVPIAIQKIYIEMHADLDSCTEVDIDITLSIDKTLKTHP